MCTFFSVLYWQWLFMKTYAHLHHIYACMSTRAFVMIISMVFFLPKTKWLQVQTKQTQNSWRKHIFLQNIHMLSSSKIKRNPEKKRTVCIMKNDISNKRWKTRFSHNNNVWKIDGKLKMCNTMILSLCLCMQSNVTDWV